MADLAALLPDGTADDHQQLARRLRRAKITIICDEHDRRLSHEPT